MTADTLKTTRVLELYQDFLSGKLINKQQAAEQYHVNVRSIQRDIDSIRDFLSEQCAKEGIVRKIEYDKKENAFVNGGKSGVASGVQSVVGYGIGRTIGQVATNAIEGVLSNAGLEITANISKMCTMGTVGAITVAVFSTVQFVKLIYRGECLKSAAIQVGKQALFSLSLLAISIAAQGMWGGPAGIIVSIGTGIVIVSYTIADAVHQRTFAEECHIKTIEEYGRLALRHLNELQFA